MTAQLFVAVCRNNVEGVQRAIREGDNVNAVRGHTTPLFHACMRDNAEIIGLLLEAGADAWWSDKDGWSAILTAISYRRLSAVQLLIKHDNGLLEISDKDGLTPLIVAVRYQDSDIVRFLLDSGADANHVDHFGNTALIAACQYDSLDNVRLLLGAGTDVDAHDRMQDTAMHHAARRGQLEVVRELILQHNANMFVVSRGCTPFDLANTSGAAVNPLLEIYGNKLTQDHGRLALHELLKVAEYSFGDVEWFHAPLYPLQIILPLGKLKLTNLRTLLHTLDPELIRNRDDTGKLPIHIACQTNAPVEVLALILELDPTTLHMADCTGALPIHFLCGSTAATEFASVRCLVEQGGVGTLAARNHQGALPLHNLCGSTNPPLRAVQYLIQSFPGSVAVPTNAGQYPFMMAAACERSTATSLSVVYAIVRANPNLIVPR